MKTFTYNDYIKCIHTLRLNAIFQFAEEGSEYILEENDISIKSNGIVKDILKKEKEMAKFINQFLRPTEKIKSENLMKYKIKYNALKYKSQKPDLLYKLKNEEIYFLVEQKAILDSTVVYQLLNYCIDIMYDWSKTKKTEQEVFYPIIVPIIVYTGGKKYNFSKKPKEKTISNYVFENYKIDIKYNLIDISKLSDKYFLKLHSLFGYAMFIAKSKNKEELKEHIKIVIEKNENKKDLIYIKNIILERFNNLLEDANIKEILEKI